MLLLAPMANWMFPNFIPALRDLCSAVYAYPYGDGMGNWARPGWGSLRDSLMERVAADVEEIAAGFGLDAVLMLQYDDSVPRRHLERIRTAGVTLVNYHADMETQWYRVLQMAPTLDLLAVAHRSHLEPYRRRGVPLHFMPMAAAPEVWSTPADARERDLDVLVLGSASNERARVVAACVETGHAVHVVGRNWDRIGLDGAARSLDLETRWPRPPAKKKLDASYLLPRLREEGVGLLRRPRGEPLSPEVASRARGATFHGYADDALLRDFVSRAKIVVGINQRAGRIGSDGGYADARLRDFEIPMAGACYLVQHYEDLPLFYDVGDEVESWVDLPTLAAKITMLLDDGERRQAISAGGRRKALREHTWRRRLQDLFTFLGFGETGTGSAPRAPLHVVRNLSSREWRRDWAGCSDPDPASRLAPELRPLS